MSEFNDLRRRFIVLEKSFFDPSTKKKKKKGSHVSIDRFVVVEGFDGVVQQLFDVENRHSRFYVERDRIKSKSLSFTFGVAFQCGRFAGEGFAQDDDLQSKGRKHRRRKFILKERILLHRSSSMFSLPPLDERDDEDDRRCIRRSDCLREECV